MDRLGDLEGLSGHLVKLPYDSDFEDEQYADSNYTDEAIEWDMPFKPGLAHGSYLFHYSWDQAAYWVCSVYDPNGCSWQDEETYSAYYRFTWNGAKVDVAPIARPKVPQSVRVAAHKHYFTVSWNKPVEPAGGAKIDSYQVRVRNSYYERDIVRTVKASSRSIKVSGRFNGHHMFAVAVRAHNLAGYGVERDRYVYPDTIPG